MIEKATSVTILVERENQHTCSDEIFAVVGTQTTRMSRSKESSSFASPFIRKCREKCMGKASV